MNLEHLGAGTRLLDTRNGRMLVLQSRINPWGAVPPYWSVKNVATGRVSIIREARILSGKRFVRA